MPAKPGVDNRTCFQVNLRDALACQSCGKHPQAIENYHRGFEYHHVVPRSAGGSDTVENLVLLCHDCHMAQHRPSPRLRPTGQPSSNLEQTSRAVANVVKSAVTAFACKACQHTLDPQTVEMNCGWYRCDACTTQTHLFEHFYT